MNRKQRRASASQQRRVAAADPGFLDRKHLLDHNHDAMRHRIETGGLAHISDPVIVLADTTDYYGKQLADALKVDVAAENAKYAARRETPTLLAALPREVALEMTAKTHPGVHNGLRELASETSVIPVLVVASGGVTLAMTERPESVVEPTLN